MPTVRATGLLSPARSSLSPTSAHATGGSSILPAARENPLRPGSQKEIWLINYVDERILRITRRYAKKFSTNQPQDDAAGYTTFEEVLEDMNRVFEVVWVSGTPSIQTPYFLSIAGLLCSYMPAFPFSTSLFPMTRKLDAAFTYLLRTYSDMMIGIDIESSYRVSMTDRVRIKSLIEDTRVVAVNVAGQNDLRAQLQDLVESDEDDTELESGIGNNDGAPLSSDALSISISRIYRQTLDILGDALV